MQMVDQWQCPLCGEIMEKSETWTTDLSPATGTVQCGHCGGAVNASDVQRGQYDVGPRAATGGGKGFLKGCVGGCCGCFVLVAVGFVALAIALPWIIGSVEGPDYSAEAMEMYGGDLSRLEGHIEELPREQIEALVLEELRAKPISDLFVDPTIPPDKLTNARASCMVPDGEQVFGLIDATVSGTAENAMLFGAKGIYYHNGWAGTPEGPGTLPYYRFPMTQFASHGFDVSVGDNCNFDASGSDAEAGAIVDLLSRITRALLDTVPEEARGDVALDEADLAPDDEEEENEGQ
jgi:hypothetical protein